MFIKHHSPGTTTIIHTAAISFTVRRRSFFSFFLVHFFPIYTFLIGLIISHVMCVFTLIILLWVPFHQIIKCNVILWSPSLWLITCDKSDVISSNNRVCDGLNGLWLMQIVVVKNRELRKNWVREINIKMRNEQWAWKQYR